MKHPPTATPAAPLEEIRLGMNMTRTDFAALLGLPFGACYNACLGLSMIPRRCWPALEELGHDPPALVAETRTWLEERGADRRAQLGKGGGAND